MYGRVLLAFGVLLAWVGVARADDGSGPDLTLPTMVYAVQGVPAEIYFANLVRSEDLTGLTFRVQSELGSANDRRWHFDPKRRHIGDHPLKIEVLDDNGQLMDSGETIVRVSRADAGQHLSIKILLVGDSLTQAHMYPYQLYQRLQQPGNPQFELLGSQAPAAYPGVRHEGYAGWSWRRFVRRYVYEAYDPQYPQRGSSPFVTLRSGGEKKLDIGPYQDLRLLGARPDIIVVALGVNDCFETRADAMVYIDRCIDEMVHEADTLIAAFKRQFPRVVIAVSLTQPANSRYGAFASTYGEKRSRAEYVLIRHRMVQRELEHFHRPKQGVVVFPIGLGLDTVKGFDAANALHPNILGYSQMADAVYAWLKAELTRRESPSVPY
jgi:hypothetical protein